MRIAIFVDTYAPYINGVVTHVRVLKEGLEKKGHSVLIVTAETKIKHHYLENGVLFCPSVGFKNLYDYGLASPVSKTRSKYLKEFHPDIIHIHQEFGIGLSGLISAKSLEIPIVYTLHTMYDEYLYYLMPKRMTPLAKKLMRQYSKFFATNAASLTGPSKKVDEYFKKCGVEKKVNVIPNPVETDLFDRNNVTPEQISVLKQHLHLGEDKKILVFCGRLGHEKNLNFLMDSFKEVIGVLPEFHLVLLGGSPLKSEFESYAREIGMKNHITFVGEVVHDELVPYYCMADFYITASISDTNSISMLEAMSTGLPVLHIKDELNKGQVVHGENGYIFQTPQDIIKILQEFYQLSQEERNQMIANTINVVKRLGADTLAENILSVYAQSFESEEK